MTDDPEPARGLAALSDMIGRAAHGDRWPDVKAADHAAAEAAKLAASRKAREDRFYEIVGRIAIVIALVGMFAILAAASLAAWRWVLL